LGHRAGARRTVLFHHDPSHTDDMLDDMLAAARDSWAALGEDPEQVLMASEPLELDVSRAAVAK
jgi:hypothetical protein